MPNIKSVIVVNIQAEEYWAKSCSLVAHEFCAALDTALVSWSDDLREDAVGVAMYPNMRNVMGSHAVYSNGGVRRTPRYGLLNDTRLGEIHKYTKMLAYVAAGALVKRGLRLN